MSPLRALLGRLRALQIDSGAARASDYRDGYLNALEDSIELLLELAWEIGDEAAEEG